MKFPSWGTSNRLVVLEAPGTSTLEGPGMSAGLVCLGNATGRLGGATGRLGGATNDLGGVTRRLGGVARRLGGVTGRLGPAAGCLGGVTGRLGGVTGLLGASIGRLGGATGLGDLSVPYKFTGGVAIRIEDPPSATRWVGMSPTLTWRSL